MRFDIIRIKIKEIEESLQLVEDNLPESYAEFSKLCLVKDGIFKRLEFCIENIFSICAIINTDLKLGIPEGPLWSKLQTGKNVTVKGKKFKPEQVMNYSKGRKGKKPNYSWF